MSGTLTIDGLDAGYGRVGVLRGLDMEVRDGEIVAILGSNGAGKSTLLRTISGLIRPTAGRIRLDGDDVAGKNPEDVSRSGLVMVPEGRQLFAGMTVRENLLLGAYAERRRRSVVQERLAQAHALFPILEERADQVAGSLSGGQQQMVAIGRGLMAGPKVLLLDEPSLGLAPAVLAQVFDALRALREQGVTILVVEQNVMMTLALADRAYVLQRGEVVIEGTSEELQSDARVREAYLGFTTAAAAG
ncbi:ABC transporter ATP-binding protein [Patulibacter minatonensis]|uniref:ABC transporter ATP-binding protein n=1 Tax=Patulibacter minatonensis TaxID=298163 RepID=UPI00047CC8D4|nr:ABC transporter ATP-binding protein [Patulibacter minatonensis]